MSLETFRTSRPARSVSRRVAVPTRPPLTSPINTYHVLALCISRTKRNQAPCTPHISSLALLLRAELTRPNVAVQEPRLEQIRQVDRRSIVEPSDRVDQLLKLDGELTRLPTSKRRKNDSELHATSSALLTVQGRGERTSQPKGIRSMARQTRPSRGGGVERSGEEGRGRALMPREKVVRLHGRDALGVDFWWCAFIVGR